MSDEYRLIIFGCSHIGSINHHADGMLQLVDSLSQKNTYGLNLGDNIEAIAPGDKRFSWSAVSPSELTPQEQTNKFIKIVRPVKEKILAIGIGNHEYKLYNIADFGKRMPAQDICRP